MLRRSFSSLIACFTLVAMLVQGTWVLAGTTGTISGTVIDTATKQRSRGRQSQRFESVASATVNADSQGHYTFISLSPDTYVLSVEYNGYDSSLVSGVTVQADQVRVVPLSLSKSFTTIAVVRNRSVSALVKPGTTSDVYSITAAQQEKLAARRRRRQPQQRLVGHRDRPRRVRFCRVKADTSAPAASLSIRGGDYDQIGYEIDGVPVNRAFDNYPSGPASSLGQGELQVYTGGGPARPKPTVSPVSSTRSSGPDPIRDSATLTSASADRRTTTRRASNSVALRPTTTSRTTSASAATIRTSASPTSSTARR